MYLYFSGARKAGCGIPEPYVVRFCKTTVTSFNEVICPPASGPSPKVVVSWLALVKLTISPVAKLSQFVLGFSPNPFHDIATRSLGLGRFLWARKVSCRGSAAFLP